ncbi:cytochrome b [Kiloniella litopenaei]|uniref:cytochrome b n=1 Tax=Kiloniella litopenaei TaxID=1549748 RepID=UPI003BAB9677
MSIKSTNAHYGFVAVTIHWLSAFLILALIGTGFKAADTLDPVVKARILSAHVPIGITIFLLTLARIGWWCFDTKPEALGNTPKWQEKLAKGIHFLLYLIMLGMGISGLGMFVLSGAGVVIFGGTGEALPDFTLYPPRVPHGIGARLMAILFILHAGAALYHHFIKRDATIRRMWFGSN